LTTEERSAGRDSPERLIDGDERGDDTMTTMMEQRERVAYMDLKAIKSHADAYALATALEQKMANAETIEMNCISFTHYGDGKFSANWDYYYDHKTFYTCELADFIIWPNRKAINDYLKSC
jgi:hypothetical protein